MSTMQRQRGLGLIELMVGLAIGLFLLAGLTNIFQQNRRTYSYQQSQAGQQSNERLVDIVIGNALREAGFAQMTNPRILNRVDVFPAAAPFAAGETVLGTEATANVNVVDGGVQAFPNDTLAVRYWDGPGIVNCTGFPVAAGTLSTDVIATDGVSLTCSTNGGPAQPLLGDALGPIDQQVRVLGLAIGYGLDTDGDESVDTYQRAASVLNWNQVRVAEVELTIQSGRRPPETLSFAVTLENMQGAI